MCNPGAVIGGAVNFIGSASAATAENQARKQEYTAALQKREADWMQQLSIAGAEKVQYDLGIDQSSLALVKGFTNLEDQRDALIAKAYQLNEDRFKNFLQNSTSSKLITSGATGRSVNRIGNLDLASYLKEGSREAYKLTQNEYAFKQGANVLREQAKADRSQQFANVMWEKVPGFKPPKPVYRNPLIAGIVGGFQGAAQGHKAFT